jgi:hypothetical protein
VRLFCKTVACKSSALHGSRCGALSLHKCTVLSVIFDRRVQMCRICMARDVAHQVRINARIYPSLLLAAFKCGEKCVRLWLANKITDTKAARKICDCVKLYKKYI